MTWRGAPNGSGFAYRAGRVALRRADRTATETWKNLMSLPLSLSRRILVALSMLVVATAAPSAQAPIVSIKYQSGEPIANWTKVTSSVTLEFIVQVCSPNQLSSVTASISNSGGSTGITLSDGAYANCPNGGTAYFAEATLTPDQNDINV